jgi:hypothetical protein
VSTKTTKAKKQREPRELTVTVSRTVQIVQFSPVTVTVTEVHELAEGDDARSVRNEVFNNVSGSVARYIDHEIKRYTEEDGND